MGYDTGQHASAHTNGCCQAYQWLLPSTTPTTDQSRLRHQGPGLGMRVTDLCLLFLLDGKHFKQHLQGVVAVKPPVASRNTVVRPMECGDDSHRSAHASHVHIHEGHIRETRRAPFGMQWLTVRLCMAYTASMAQRCRWKAVCPPMPLPTNRTASYQSTKGARQRRTAKGKVCIPAFNTHTQKRGGGGD